jgi:hypothetical protein
MFDVQIAYIPKQTDIEEGENRETSTYSGRGRNLILIYRVHQVTVGFTRLYQLREAMKQFPRYHDKVSSSVGSILCFFRPYEVYTLL